LGRKIVAELIGTRLVVWAPGDSVSIYRQGFFGKPVGIPKPKPDQDFSAPLVLDMMEGLFLLEKRRIKIIDAGNRRPVTRARLMKLASVAYKDFELGYSVYKGLRESGFIVTPGIRFGSDFAVYEHGPGIDHAPFIVTGRTENDRMGPFEIVLAGRLATTVRKQFTIAVPKKKGKMDYLVFRWFKA
jgi:tRNA-intron endonuclease